MVTADAMISMICENMWDKEYITYMISTHAHRLTAPTPRKISFFGGDNRQPEISLLSQSIISTAEPQTKPPARGSAARRTVRSNFAQIKLPHSFAPIVRGTGLEIMVTENIFRGASCRNNSC